MHGLFIKKVHVLNQGIVHLIDDIFWNCGFKTETSWEQVILIVIIVIILLYSVIVIIQLYCCYCDNCILCILF